MKLYFTADLHFNHFPIIQYCNRPFKNIDEMNETLIYNWNKAIPPTGIVYVLGDLIFGRKKGYGTLDVKKILNRLHGQIILIEGDHDKPAKKLYKEGYKKIVKITPLHRIKIDGQDIILCHYCMRVWYKSHYNSWHLYGHSHGRLEPIGKSLDVGVDNHCFFPWTWEEIKEYMKDRPNNFNFIETYFGRGL